MTTPYLPKSNYKNNNKNAITLYGYFVNYDQYNRAKLMFLDDYNCEDGLVSINKSKLNIDKFLNNKNSFTKSYLINKASKTAGNNPIIDNKYFLINCVKNIVGYKPSEIDSLKFNNLPTEKPQKINLIPMPIQELIQNTVVCEVTIKNYKFIDKNKEIIQGWNIKLLKMTSINH
jgi:hypothetical protein